MLGTHSCSPDFLKELRVLAQTNIVLQTRVSLTDLRERRGLCLVLQTRVSLTDLRECRGLCRNNHTVNWAASLTPCCSADPGSSSSWPVTPLPRENHCLRKAPLPQKPSQHPSLLLAAFSQVQETITPTGGCQSLTGSYISRAQGSCLSCSLLYF